MLPTGDKTVVSTRVFSRVKEGAGRLSLSSFYKVTNERFLWFWTYLGKTFHVTWHDKEIGKQTFNN